MDLDEALSLARNPAGRQSPLITALANEVERLHEQLRELCAAPTAFGLHRVAVKVSDVTSILDAR